MDPKFCKKKGFTQKSEALFVLEVERIELSSSASSAQVTTCLVS